MPAGRYDADNILYNEGMPMGNQIFFDSRNYVMSKTEFQENFEIIKDGDSK